MVGSVHSHKSVRSGISRVGNFSISTRLASYINGVKTGPRILIVDDNAEAGGALLALLRAGGHHEVRLANSGKAALAIAAKFRPAVVLMEFDLPDMSSYDVARLLSQHPQLQDVRLIGLTKGGEHTGREHARASGFERYLLKPVSSADLEKLLTRSAS